MKGERERWEMGSIRALMEGWEKGEKWGRRDEGKRIVILEMLTWTRGELDEKGRSEHKPEEIDGVREED